MSATAEERLYNWLPAIYRQRDQEHDQPLRALLGVMESEMRLLEADMTALYEDWFIETCAEWVVPYIGDLLGVRGLTDSRQLAFSQRARVANTIGYRRRKGVAAVLENAVQDATGWRARALEYFELLGATQHLQHLRPGQGGSVDLRAAAALEATGGPFETIPHLVDVRRIAAGQVRYNLINIGIFVWRLHSYPLTHRAGVPFEGAGPGQYTFHPLGQDLPLFNRPQTKTDLAQTSGLTNLPAPIGRQALEADLRAYRGRYTTSPAEHRPADSAITGPQRSLSLLRDGSPVSPLEMISLDLESWPRPAAGQVAIDPQLGRITFAEGEEPEELLVSYHYGFPADLGGGPYDRRASLDAPGPQDWQTTLAQRGSGNGLQPDGAEERFTSLAEALAEFKASESKRGLIHILDSGEYELAALDLPPQSVLTIQAADGVRPVLRCGADRRLAVGAPDASQATLKLNGLLVDGSLLIQGGLRLTLLHCSLPDGVRGGELEMGVQVEIGHSLVGPLYLPADNVDLHVQDSLVNGAGGYAIAADPAGEVFGPRISLARTTLFGPVKVRELAMASEVIFTALVSVERRQSGAVRFSYVPPDSLTPQRYRCQPDLAVADKSGDEKNQIQRRLIPAFTSVHPGDPHYGQLATNCAEEIRRGAEDGSELGAYHQLYQPQRAANLRACLDEYLPAGLEAGVIYVT